MSIEEAYAVWEGTEFKDKDMKKSFEKEITTQVVIELIKKVESLEQTKVGSPTINNRKIIQLINPTDSSPLPHLTALCDDGTIWYYLGTNWVLFSKQVPQYEINWE